MSTSSRYAGRGVSSSKEDVHAAIKKGFILKRFVKLSPTVFPEIPIHA